VYLHHINLSQSIRTAAKHEATGELAQMFAVKSSVEKLHVRKLIME